MSAPELIDEFRGDNAHLVTCITALIGIDARGALWPHPLGGHAKALLASAAVRLAAIEKDRGTRSPDVHQSAAGPWQAIPAEDLDTLEPKLTFADLQEGQHFKFHATGSLLTKTGARRYAAPQWGQHDLTTERETPVIVEPELAKGTKP